MSIKICAAGLCFSFYFRKCVYQTYVRWKIVEIVWGKIKWATGDDWQGEVLGTGSWKGVPLVLTGGVLSALTTWARNQVCSDSVHNWRYGFLCRWKVKKNWLGRTKKKFCFRSPNRFTFGGETEFFCPTYHLYSKKFLEKGQGNPVRNVGMKKTRLLVLRER